MSNHPIFKYLYDGPPPVKVRQRYRGGDQAHRMGPGERFEHSMRPLQRAAARLIGDDPYAYKMVVRHYTPWERFRFWLSETAIAIRESFR